jgi:hypothetical protein
MFNRFPVRAGGFLWGALPNFFLGAAAMGLLIALFKQGKPRLSRTMEVGLGKFSGKELDLDELIAEKERLEELIIELAAKQEKKSTG